METITTGPAAVANLAFESPTRELHGRSAALGTALALGLSLYALYWVVGIVQPQVYRVTFLLLALVLCFLFYPRGRGDRTRVTAVDWVLIAVSIAALAWPILDFERFIYRAADPTPTPMSRSGRR